MKDTIRRCVFRPYLPGRGPSFDLVMWDTGRTDARGTTTIGYTLRIRAHKGAKAIVLFTGEDFNGSPSHADDSDATVRGLMGFLTTKSSEEDYTMGQLAYFDHHAETLSCVIQDRFGED